MYTERVQLTWVEVAVGAYPVYVEVDPENAIAESNEDNNEKVRMLLVAADRGFLPVASRRPVRRRTCHRAFDGSTR